MRKKPGIVKLIRWLSSFFPFDIYLDLYCTGLIMGCMSWNWLLWVSLQRRTMAVCLHTP